VVRHAKNRGKGAALRTGLTRAAELGVDLAVSVDADGQHLAEDAVRLALDRAPADGLLLGVRDLAREGAPRANQFSNRFSNVFVSGFSGQRLADTQCGLRRYPVRRTLDLGVRSNGYAFEAEVILRAARARWPIAQVPVRAVYPPNGARTSHFHVVRDPTRIVFRILYTVATAPGPR
jgi:glycosyltransferase involved in cell wall biosynthesis